MFSTRSNSISHTLAHSHATKKAVEKTRHKIKLYDRIHKRTHTSNTHKPIYRIQFIENGFFQVVKKTNTKVEEEKIQTTTPRLV